MPGRLCALIACALFCASCDSPSRGAPASARGGASSAEAVMEARVGSAEELTVAVGKALQGGDAQVLVGLLPREGGTRVEVRQSLVETDERGSRNLATGTDATSWLREARAQWSCTGAECRWPGGVVVNGKPTCAGLCCRLSYAGGLDKGRLYFTRACFRDEGGSHKGRRPMTLLELTEAK